MLHFIDCDDDDHDGTPSLRDSFGSCSERSNSSSSLAEEVSRPSQRHVTFAPDTEHQVYPPPYHLEDLTFQDIWYSEHDCAALQAALVEDARKCTDPAALAWLRSLTQTYRDLQDVPIFLRTFFGKPPPSNDAPVEAWFLGMEQWILARALHRDARRERISKRVRFWQQQERREQKHGNDGSAQEYQIYKASERESYMACKLSAYIGRRVAESVLQEQLQDLHC